MGPVCRIGAGLRSGAIRHIHNRTTLFDKPMVLEAVERRSDGFPGNADILRTLCVFDLYKAENLLPLFRGTLGKLRLSHRHSLRG